MLIWVSKMWRIDWCDEYLFKGYLYYSGDGFSSDVYVVFYIFSFWLLRKVVMSEIFL